MTNDNMIQNKYITTKKINIKVVLNPDSNIDFFNLIFENDFIVSPNFRQKVANISEKSKRSLETFLSKPTKNLGANLRFRWKARA